MIKNIIIQLGVGMSLIGSLSSCSAIYQLASLSYSRRATFCNKVGEKTSAACRMFLKAIFTWWFQAEQQRSFNSVHPAT